MTILAIAAAALGALAAFGRTTDAPPPESNTGVTKIRRATSVVLAISEAIWTVLDALVFVTGRRVQSVTVGTRNGGGLSRPPFGSQTSSDVSAE
jgi:hypothetical protein